MIQYIVNSIPALHDPRTVVYSNEACVLYAIPDFFTAEECELLIAEGTKYLEPSRVGAPNDTTKIDRSVRSSSTSMLSTVSDAAITQTAIERIAQAYGHPNLFSDPLQFNTYRVGEEFVAHHDYHDPETNVARIGREGQRTWTFLMYLNDDFEGGETEFPELSTVIKPTRGMLVFWNNLNADGTVNPATLHQSNPVTSGTKHMMTKWHKNKILTAV